MADASIRDATPASLVAEKKLASFVHHQHCPALQNCYFSL